MRYKGGGGSGGSGGGGGGGSAATWTRYLLNSGSTRADPGGGSTITVNSESGAGWTDISRAASADKKMDEHTTWSIALTQADGSALTWADQFTVETHMVINQATAAGDTFAGQVIMPAVANAAVPSTSSHYWWGEGLYSSNGTTVKMAMVYSSNSANDPTFAAQQIKATGWTNNGRVHAIYTNNVQRGAFLGAACFRKLDNAVFTAGNMNDQQGFHTLEDDIADGPGATDGVYLIFCAPGWNASSAYDLVNTQFKLYYNVKSLPQDPTA